MKPVLYLTELSRVVTLIIRPAEAACPRAVRFLIVFLYEVCLPALSLKWLVTRWADERYHRRPFASFLPIRYRC